MKMDECGNLRDLIPAKTSTAKLPFIAKIPFTLQRPLGFERNTLLACDIS